MARATLALVVPVLVLVQAVVVGVEAGEGVE